MIDGVKAVAILMWRLTPGRNDETSWMLVG